MGVTVEIRKDGGFAVVTINSPPVNSMTLELFEDLIATLDTLEGNADVQGILFRSGLDRPIFTAGLDIKELHADFTTEQKFRKFWWTLTRFYSRLYCSPLATVAAIKGACPAGGCLLALACDRRVQTSKGVIGLNEAAMGITVPPFWVELMARRIGHPAAARLTQFSVMPSPREALRLGLVDVVVEDASELEGAAEAELKDMLKVTFRGRASTKVGQTIGFAERWYADLQTSTDAFWKSLNAPETRAGLSAYLASLSAKKKKR